MNPEIMWYAISLVLLVVYLAIQILTKNKKYFIYFILGSVFGFYFDYVSFVNGYYSYPNFYYFKLFGLPISMTLSEGFSVAILMYLFEKFILKQDSR